MGRTAQKVIVLLVGFALVMGFGAGAILGGPSTTDASAYLARYDEQATAFWLAGESQWPLLDQASAAERNRVLAEGRRLQAAQVTSTQTKVSDEGDRLVVEADVQTLLRLSQGNAEPQDAGSTVAHRLVFDEATGELLEDAVEPNS